MTELCHFTCTEDSAAPQRLEMGRSSMIVPCRLWGCLACVL